MNEQTTSQNNVPNNEPLLNATNPHGNKLLSVMSYLGILVIVSYLLAKDDQTVKFHVRQGLVLFSIEVIMWVLGILMWRLWPIIQIVNLAIFVLSIIGIINAVTDKEKELPLVGSFSKYFRV